MDCEDSMTNFDLVKHAFENAIKTVGLETFKKTSLFVRNDAVSGLESESQAA